MHRAGQDATVSQAHQGCTSRSAGNGRAGSGSTGPINLKLGGIGRSHSTAKSAMHSVMTSRCRSLSSSGSTPNRRLHKCTHQACDTPQHSTIHLCVTSRIANQARLLCCHDVSLSGLHSKGRPASLVCCTELIDFSGFSSQEEPRLTKCLVPVAALL